MVFLCQNQPSTEPLRPGSRLNRKLPAVIAVALVIVAALLSAPAFAADGAATPWWIWPLTLFVVSFALGIVAVLAGVGGGVLFVPIVAGFFPFHIDFVRGAGILLAMSSALAAAPGLLRSGMANLRLAMPLALIGSITSIGGALLGFALPTNVLEIALGAVILGVAALMWRGIRAERPHADASDPLGLALGMHGLYHDPALGRDVEWAVRRTPAAIGAFAGIGVLAGMFGLGAGWANVPMFNLLMGVPLKLSVGTSGLLLSIVDTSAAWIYIHRGAVLPILVAPSIIGVMLGARIGARMLRITPSLVIRRIVVSLLFIAGARALAKGLGF